MKNLLLFCTALLLFSCQNETNNATQTSTSEPSTKDTVTVAETEPITELNQAPAIKSDGITGSYVGMFTALSYKKDKMPTWENKINVTIDNIEADKITGHSVVAGNARPFEGTIVPKKTDKSKFDVVVNEPGDDRYDGIFTFTIHPKDKKIVGIWEANDTSLAVNARSYDLEKRNWHYNPKLKLEGLDYTILYHPYNDEMGEREMLTEDVESKNPSMEELTKADIENLHKGDLEVMRNSIYARHGYSFKNRKMRYVFNHVDWYVPISTDIRSELTELEQKNIALLKRYEEHAERYYDAFGR